jgi:methylated-DNA-[protein]-cysteine S-methyltransferase
MRWSAVPTGMGELGVAVDDDGVCRVDFRGVPDLSGEPSRGRGVAEASVPTSFRERSAPDLLREPSRGRVGGDPVLGGAVAQLVAYFAGELTEFDLPLSIRGGSPFERAVWHELAAIPYAEMRTYGQIAAAVGDLSAARAVGVACNRNPLPVIVPCHRVVGAGGKLVGFGGGLARKRFLLELEARVRIERDFTAPA